MAESGKEAGPTQFEWPRSHEKLEKLKRKAFLVRDFDEVPFVSPVFVARAFSNIPSASSCSNPTTGVLVTRCYGILRTFRLKCIASFEMTPKLYQWPLQCEPAFALSSLCLSHHAFFALKQSSSNKAYYTGRSEMGVLYDSTGIQLHVTMVMNEALQFSRSAISAISHRAGNTVLSCLTWIVFTGLDVIDQLLCPVFAFLDFFLDSEKRHCYCWSKEIQQDGMAAAISKKSSSQNGAAFTEGHCPWDDWTRTSDGLYARARRSPFKGRIAERIRKGADDTLVLRTDEECRDISTRRVVIVPNANSYLRSLTENSVKSIIPSHRAVKHVIRWSDCGCERCTSWQSDTDQLLYVHVDDKDFVPSIGNEPRNELGVGNIGAENNVIFLHGFLSSSSFWVDTVLPALPKSVRASHRLFAADIMGFGRSPKPSNSMYTIADHIDMIRRSVLEPHGIKSFHIVAHSMGCTIALALAAHYPSAVKSVTLVAPSYYPGISGDSPSTDVMQQAAARRIWPLISFGSAVMSWYEHVGRVVCFVVCKHHRVWEPLLLFVYSKIPGNGAPLSCLTDFTRHTHHSAWHNFHNTICNGGYIADHCIEVLRKAGKAVRVIHGTRDVVIPFKSSVSLSERHPNVRLTLVPSSDHSSVVFGREAELAQELAEEILCEPVERRRA